MQKLDKKNPKKKNKIHISRYNNNKTYEKDEKGLVENNKSNINKNCIKYEK